MKIEELLWEKSGVFAPGLDCVVPQDLSDRRFLEVEMWPYWPYCPLKRTVERADGSMNMENCVLVSQALTELVGRPGLVTLKTNVFEMAAMSRDSFVTDLADKGVTYDNIDALLADGWKVD